MTTSKGIVIAPNVQPTSGGGFSISATPDAQEIRKYLLYWDKIDYPDTKPLSMGLSSDLEFLKDCGILKRTAVTHSGKVVISRNDLTYFVNTQLVAFKTNESEEPGCWSLAQFMDRAFYPNTSSQNGIEFELTKCLPVPYVDVPFQDILEFKAKRQDELTALRVYLDELYQSIIVAGDIPRAKNMALNKLELALKDINSTIQQSKFRTIATSLKGNIGNAINTGASAAGAITIMGFSFAQEAFTAGAGLSFCIKPLLLPQDTGAKNPLTYIKSIQKDLG